MAGTPTEDQGCSFVAAARYRINPVSAIMVFVRDALT